MESQKSCAVCVAIEGETYNRPFDGRIKKVKIESHHIIPKIWTDLAEFKDLTVPLCSRCHNCCAPNTIAAYNHNISHEAARVLSNIFPMLDFRVEKHDFGFPRGPLTGSYCMMIIKKPSKKSL